MVSLALQLAGGLIKLYDFWGTVQDAPAEVGEMLMDLKLLSRILNELVNRKDPGTHVQDALEHCDGKVQVSGWSRFPLDETMLIHYSYFSVSSESSSQISRNTAVE